MVRDNDTKRNKADTTENLQPMQPRRGPRIPHSGCGDISGYLWKQALQVSYDPRGQDLFPLDPRWIPTLAGYQDSEQAKMGHSKQRCHMGMSKTSDSKQRLEQALLPAPVAPEAPQAPRGDSKEA